MQIKEDGKTFYQHADGFLTRQHDENYSGARFKHRRCPFCNRITSIASLHWLNHLDKCAPKKYSNADLLQMRWKSLEDCIFYNFIGRD